MLRDMYIVSLVRFFDIEKVKGVEYLLYLILQDTFYILCKKKRVFGSSKSYLNWLHEYNTF